LLPLSFGSSLLRLLFQRRIAAPSVPLAAPYCEGSAFSERRQAALQKSGGKPPHSKKNRKQPGHPSGGPAFHWFTSRL